MSGEGRGDLVIGGGPAGAMLAWGLANSGQPVTLLERSAGPHHKVCGEFLSWEARRMLAQAGVDLQALGGADIDRLRLVDGQRQTETPLPGTAMGISRYRLDAALLDHAAAAGADIRRDVHVRALVDDRSVRLATGERATSGRLWLATGKTDLRGAGRDLSGQRVTDHLVGFKLHLQLARADRASLDRTVELHRFGGGYAGLQPIEGGAANLCLLVDQTLANTGWAGVRQHLGRTAPLLNARLEQAQPLYDQPLAISRVPYGFIHRGAGGPVRVGDQLGVIHSFTGDGMAIAIASGLAAARSVDLPATRAMPILQDLVRHPVRRAALGYRLFASGGAAFALAIRMPPLLRWMARLTRII